MNEALLQMQEQFNKAERQSDAAATAVLLDVHFKAIGPKGFVLDKSAWVDRLNKFKYQNFVVSDIDITTYQNVGIVRSIQKSVATYNGELVKTKLRASHVWVAGASWKLASIQFSAMD